MSDGPRFSREEVDLAFKLARKHIYDGHEPYAPAMMSIVRMLREHRELVQADRTAQLELAVLDALMPQDIGNTPVRIRTAVAMELVSIDMVLEVLERLKREGRVIEQDGIWRTYEKEEPAQTS